MSEISDQYLSEEVIWHNRNIENQFSKFLNWAHCSYDVILLDCQAGYTELLPVLLPMVDVDLFVLEADSISGSAMRSLHLKTGRSLSHARLYQIFNKATPEEFEIYSKIVGTFFTNIGTLLFDWKIRQAFSRSQTPDLENTSAKYGSDLCDICKIILPEKDIQKKLDYFSAKLRYQKLEEDREQTEIRLYKFIEKPYLREKIILFIQLFTVMVSILIFILGKDVFSSYALTIMISSLLFAIIFTLVGMFINSFQKNRKERHQIEHKLRDLDRELEKLDQLLQDNSNG